jgi:hypothetical protein
MDTLPVFSTNITLFQRIERLAARKKSPVFSRVALMKPDLAIDFLNMEMPELVCMDFSDKNFNAFALMENIMADPWIFHGGIIALCSGYDDFARLDGIKGANIIVVIMWEDLERDMPKIMDVVRNNRRILFQRELGIDIVWNISGSFKMENDPLEANCFANLISNFLCNFIEAVKRKPHYALFLSKLLAQRIQRLNERAFKS